MLCRACYLREAISQYLGQADSKIRQKISCYDITEDEWEQMELLTSILLPFKRASVKLQATRRPRIDHVFWTYESLFNTIDKLEGHIKRKFRGNSWAAALGKGVCQMRDKLAKYYQKMENPFVYPDSVILEPAGKLLLFEQQSWNDGHDWKRQYTADCRARYVEYYERVDGVVSNQNSSKKWKRGVDDNDDEEDDYYHALAAAAKVRGEQNEFDLYLAAPNAMTKDPLGWWRANRPSFPRLARMFRDTFPVPATGAGVEREFSMGRRVASWTRARLHHRTISDTMMVKNMLARHGNKLSDVIEGSDESEVETDEETCDLFEEKGAKELLAKALMDDTDSILDSM
jgi:hypothetical protein